MIELREKLAKDDESPVFGQLCLPFELRQKTRLRTRLVDGREAALLLPRGELLRGGDRLRSGDGEVILVIAQDEDVVHVTCASPRQLARAAYHLGNRHVPVQVGEGFLRIAADHVLEEMLRGLGATTSPLCAPFEPEAGAYAGGHSHGGHVTDSSKARIHSFAPTPSFAPPSSIAALASLSVDAPPGEVSPLPSSPCAGSQVSLALVRLLQLASPALPVGAYSYSQGLEAAVEAGLVHDLATAQRWLGDALTFSVAAVEAPLWRRSFAAWRAEDFPAAAAHDAFFLSTRETSELRAESLQMGYSLARLLGELDGPAATAPLAALVAAGGGSFPAAFTFAAVRWAVEEEEALLGYLYAALENQVMAAIKAVPLGQTDGQRLLRALGATLPGLAAASAPLAAGPDADLCNFTPGLAVLSSRHEAQYSRLFRS